MCIAVRWWSVYASVWKFTVRPHISLLPQFLLVTTHHGGERKEQGLALQQEQCGNFSFRSFLYSFWSLCFSFSAAVSNFVQDSMKNFSKEGFPRIIVLQIVLIQPGVPNDNPNDNETITKKTHTPYRPDTGPWLAEKLFCLAHVARPRWAASKRKTWQGFLNKFLELKVKMWKRSFPARIPSKTESRRCENEVFVSVVVVIVVVVTVVGDSGGCDV